MSQLFLLSLFYTSFLPLWISIIFIDVCSLLKSQSNQYTEIISIACISLILIFSSIILLLAFKEMDNSTYSEYDLKQAVEEKTISIDILASIVLPLIAFDFTKWNQTILFMIYFSAFCFLSLRHNYFPSNILLEIFGYRIYECKLKDLNDVVIEKQLLSKQRLNGFIGQKLTIVRLNNQIWYLKAISSNL